MNIKDYQKQTEDFAFYPRIQPMPHIVTSMYCALGLCGEAGEVAEHIKKWHRDGNIDFELITKELGDVLWYFSQLCNELGLSMDRIMELNIEKLRDREQRDVLKGSGSSR